MLARMPRMRVLRAKAIALALLVLGTLTQVVAPTDSGVMFAWRLWVPEDDTASRQSAELMGPQAVAEYQDQVDFCEGVRFFFYFAAIVALAMAIGETCFPRFRWLFRVGWLLGSIAIYANGLFFAFIFAAFGPFFWLSAGTGLPILGGIVTGAVLPRPTKGLAASA